MKTLYTEIIPNIDLPLGNETFSYQVPKELEDKIRVGQFATIDFAHRKTFGVVKSISQIKPKFSKIADVKSILNEKFILPPIYFELAEFLSRRYLVSLPKAMFAMIPPTNPTKIKRLPALNYRSSEAPAQRGEVENHITSPPEQSPQRPSESKNKSQIILGSYSQRIGIYIREIAKTKSSTLLLLPNKFQAESCLKILEKTFGKNRVLSLIDIPAHRRFDAWAGTISTQNKIIVGTRGAIFTLPQDLKLIIIDQPESYGFSSEQAPTFSVLDLAIKIAKQSNIRLIFGEIVPGSKFYKIISEYKLPCKIAPMPKPEILYVSPPSRPILNPTILTIVNEELKNNSKTLIYVNQAGYYKMFCQNCQEYLSCPQCQTQLQLSFESEAKSAPLEKFSTSSNNKSGTLFCRRCKTSYPTNQCNICRSHNLKKHAFGLSYIQQKVEAEFSKAKIAVITSKNPLTAELFQENEIFLATSAIFANFFYSFGTAIFLDLDYFLSRPDPKILEQILKSFWQVRDLGAQKIILETQNPEHSLFVASRNLQISLQFIAALTYKLKQADLPPFVHRIMLKASPKDFEKLKKAIAGIESAIVDDSNRQVKIYVRDLNKFSVFLQKLKISSLRIAVDLP